MNKLDCKPAKEMRYVNFNGILFKLSAKEGNLQIELLNALKKILKNEDIEDAIFSVVEKEKMNKQITERIEGDCPICLEKICNPVLLKCEHVFCKKCAFEWIKLNNSCPMCRQAI